MNNNLNEDIRSIEKKGKTYRARRIKSLSLSLVALLAFSSCQLRPMGEDTKGKKTETKKDLNNLSNPSSNLLSTNPTSQTNVTIADVDLRSKEGLALVNEKILNQKVEGEFVSYEEFKNMEERERIENGVWSFTGTLLDKILADNIRVNKVISPISAYISLSSVREGAKGETRNLISKLLGLDGEADIKKDIYAYNRLFNNVVKDSSGNITRNGTSLSTCLLVKEGAKIDVPYLQNLTDFFLVEAANVNFEDSEITDKLVNSWIKERSRGFMEGSYKSNKDSIMDIVNVFTVNGKWYEEYKDAGQMDFTTSKGESKKVPSMEKKGVPAFVYKGDKYTAINDPVKDVGNVWFILPDEGVNINEITGFQKLVSLDASSMEHVRLNVKMPQINLQGMETNLAKLLGDSGYENLFKEGADFSAIASGLHISSMVQEIKMTVDPLGVRAGAVNDLSISGAKVVKDFEELNFNLNRPYIIIIEQYNMPEFIAYINDPTAN